MKEQPSTPATPLPPQGVAELLAAGKALGAPIQVSGRQPSVLVPQTYELKPLPPEPLPELPDHIRQRVTLHDAESFVAYVKRYQTPLTLLFGTLPEADGRGAGFTAIFDYHQGGKGDEQAAKRMAHRACYPCPLSAPWAAWMAINGRALTQAEFIEFIDANTREIVSPDSASLLELAINFESRTNVEFSSKVDRVTSGRQLTYKETVDAGHGGGAGSIKVPDALKLRLPVFDGGKAFDLGARLQWSPRDGRLKVAVFLQRPEDVVREALVVLRDEIDVGTGLQALIGKPE
jgi:uncharacterized protein YfdQ (DUF2303 family)